MDLDYDEIVKNKRRSYYEKNRLVLIAKQKVRQQKRKKRQFNIINSFQSDGCLLCPEKDPSCLHAHHLDPKTKEGEISSAWANAWSDKRLINELNKCVCLCANCHAKVHAGIISI